MLRKEDEGQESESVTLFPVYVMEGWEEEDDEVLSHQTKSLVYTLAACYCFDLLLLIIYMGVIVKTYVMRGKSVPAMTWIATIFLVVCLFRIVWCFVYVDGGFEDEVLAEYVMFEIPTFLLFTAVILAIALFMKLSKKRFTFCFFFSLDNLR